jgi:iron complex outermembrane receptor protein
MLMMKTARSIRRGTTRVLLTGQFLRGLGSAITCFDKVRSQTACLMLVVILGQVFHLNAAELDSSTNRLEKLKSLRLEDLLHGEVTSVSRRAEELFKSSAAAFVITSEDIRRSGAKSIPEALRMAPGLSVAQIDANKWAVAARGFNDRFTDKLLVLIDGRSVYSPTTSGVFWDVQNYLLEDIDRIEVIRGPGGALWGANAVNGVINIITKHAQDTQGGYLAGGGGTEERGFGDVRYGTKISENGFLRAYAKYLNRDHFSGGKDDWDFAQGGFRADWERPENHVTLQGDYYYGKIGQQQVVPGFAPPFLQTVDERFHTSGGNVLFRFQREFSEDSDLQLQSYFDHTERTEMVFDGYRDTVDLDFQHRFPLPLRQNFMYGLGYRYMPDHFRNPNPDFVLWKPADRQPNLFSGFVQDDIQLVEDQLRLTLGSKLEHNDYTGFEVEPNARMSWTLSPRQTFWGAISRAVQVPERNANDISTLLPTGPVGPSTFLVGNGSKDIKPQELISYELGYRIQPVDRFSLDVSTFYNEYENFITGTAGTPFFDPTPTNHFVVPITAVNGGKGRSYGIEVASEWHVTDSWRLVGTYSYLRIKLNQFAASLSSEGKDPHHQASLRSSMDLPCNLELDIWGRFVDHLATFRVRSYFDLDIRLGWNARKNLEISIVGQNLLEPHRFEFGTSQFTQTIPTPVPRGVYGQVAFKF